MKIKYTGLIAALGFLCGTTQAQVASLYAFSQQTIAYTAITGGTVFGNTTSDDQTFVDPAVPLGGANTGVGIPIGFNFMFNNNIYNRIGINNNGWIGFGSSALTPAVDISNTGSNYNGVSSTSGAPAVKQNRVGGLSRDIQAQTGASLRVETIGSAPTRTCVIQWANYKKFGTGGNGDNYNFQIRLAETTNIVQVAYGTFSNNATSGVAEVGLRGNSPTDYNNRIVTTTNPWSASVPGTANTSQVNLTSTLIPVSGETYVWTPPQCSGSLSSLAAVAAPTLICANSSATVYVAGTSTLSGLTYTWFVSDQSSVGQWTVVSGAESPLFQTQPITATNWFQAALTCLHSSSTATSTPAEVQVAATTTNSVPYYEGFEGVPVPNILPNCSWMTAGLGTGFQTYTTSASGNRLPRSGAKFGAFVAPVTNHHLYTNGIEMFPGITYSAAIHFATDYSGASNWSSLALLVGPGQSPTGLTQLAAQNPAISGPYQLLSATFTVSAPGLYYLAVRATGGGGGAPYLMIDDVSVTIPCTPESGNTPTISLLGNSPVACLGQPFNITANGADIYNWSDNSTGQVVSVIPGQLGTNTFVAAGTRTLTGCTGTAAILLNVQAPPVLHVVASPPVVCQGKSSMLIANGANTYAWSSGGNGPQTLYTPANSGVVTVIGTSTNNCVSSATVSVTVNSLPNVNASASRTFMCRGESNTITANGANTYVWVMFNSPDVLQGAQVVVKPVASDTYSVTGTDQNGCQKTGVVTIVVDECVGVAEMLRSQVLRVYPNPGTGLFVVEMRSGSQALLEVADLSGRVLMTKQTTEDKTELDISGFAAGIYTLKASGEGGVEVIRLIKN